MTDSTDKPSMFPVIRTADAAGLRGYTATDSTRPDVEGLQWSAFVYAVDVVAGDAEPDSGISLLNLARVALEVRGERTAAISRAEKAEAKVDAIRVEATELITKRNLEVQREANNFEDAREDLTTATRLLRDGLAEGTSLSKRRHWPERVRAFLATQGEP